jgi:uncharacterized protein
MVGVLNRATLCAMASVTVRGTAAASVTPDRAELSLEVSHRAKDAGDALDQVATRSQLLEQILVRHGVSRDDWATEGVHVGEDVEWRDNQQVRVGYVASTAITVTVRTLDLVGGVVRDAVTEAGASVRRLAWRVDRDNPARRALLSDAARDARVRATAYAEALGLQLGEVELVSETPFHAEPMPEMRMATAPMMSAPHGGPAMEVSAGLVELTADVHVRFALLS